MNINVLVGDFGRYQLWLNVLLFFCKYGMAFQYLAFSFLTPPMTYTCPDGQKCCNDPIFNTTEFSRTVQTEWNLICDRAWLLNLTDIIFLSGMSFGSITFGIASDEYNLHFIESLSIYTTKAVITLQPIVYRYGRRITIIVASVLETLSGILAGLSDCDFWVFTFIRMITGYSIGGLMVIAYVILIENVGTKSRDLCSAVHQLTFTLGHLSLAIIGYFVRDFIQLLLIISAFNFTLFVYICSMPESARWLLSVGQTDEAIKLLEKEARINKLPTQHIKSYITDITSSHEYRKKGITDLCNKELAWYMFLISLNWFTCNYYFFGGTQNINRIADDVITQVLLVAITGNMGVLASVPLMAHMGRVSLMVLANSICGVCLIIDAFISDPIISALLGITGVTFNCVIFVVIFVHCCEIFPTVLRGTTLGIASMWACVGTLLAPFTANLRPYGDWCEPFAYGTLPLLVALLYYSLPETKSSELPDSLEESCNRRFMPSRTASQVSKRSTVKSPSVKTNSQSTPPRTNASTTSNTEPPTLLTLIERKQNEEQSERDSD